MRGGAYGAGYEGLKEVLEAELPRSELPVEVSERHMLGINMRTARALGLSIPPTLLAPADEVIE